MDPTNPSVQISDQDQWEAQDLGRCIWIYRPLTAQFINSLPECLSDFTRWLSRPPSKHETFAQCWYNVGTLGQHCTNIEQTSCVAARLACQGESHKTRILSRANISRVQLSLCAYICLRPFSGALVRTDCVIAGSVWILGVASLWHPINQDPPDKHRLNTASLLCKAKMQYQF